MTDADAGDLAEEERTVGGHRKRRRRRRTALVTGAAVVTSAAVLGVVQWSGSKSPQAAGTEVPDAATAEVTRTDLSDSRTLQGTLGYGTAIPVRAYGEATVTWMPVTGATVRRGEPLYRMDDRPIPLFYGSTPLFRPLRTPNTVGRDVRALADNLRALGYDIGPQPALGTWVTPRTGPAARSGARDEDPSRTSDGAGADGDAAAGADDAGEDPVPSVPVKVRDGDAVLTDSLINAVKRWQRNTGVPATGVVGPEDIVVLTGAVRVAGVQARPGDHGGGELMSVTTTSKHVTVSVPAADVGTIRRGDRVKVTLPDSTRVSGKVTGLSSTVQPGSEAAGSAEDSEAKVTVTVHVEESEAVRRLDSAPVGVEFTSTTRRNVLAVSAGALLALSGGGYALQTSRGELIPVTTGIFAQGQVEVSGPGLADGMRVVTAS